MKYDGSEKQNAWADKIMAGYVATLDAEIERVRARPEADNVGKYADILADYKAKWLVNVDTKATSKMVIDAYMQKKDPTKKIISAARAAFESAK